MEEALHLLRFGEEYRVGQADRRSTESLTTTRTARGHTRSTKCTSRATTASSREASDTPSLRWYARLTCENLVDLAGSERLSSANDCEDTDKETKYINKSLFYLTKVIQLLSVGSQ